MTAEGEPRRVLEVGAVDHPFVALPAADRVALEGCARNLRQLAAVHEDLPISAILVQYDDQSGRLHDLCPSRLAQRGAQDVSRAPRLTTDRRGIVFAEIVHARDE